MTTAEAGETVGRVGRPHGRDGSFYLDDPRRTVDRGAVLVLAGEEHRIERRAGTEQRPILRLEGVADRDSAAALRGEWLRDSGPAEPSAEDEWAVDELIGCRIAGLGEVRRVLAAPSCDLLVVGDEEILVPLVRDAIRHIDPGARRIEIDRAFLNLPEADGGPGAESGSGGRSLAHPTGGDGPPEG